MGKLAGTKAYLAGPIEHSDDSGSWRESITPVLRELGITVWSPLVKPAWLEDIDGRKQRDLASKVRRGDEVSFVRNKGIRDTCLRLVNSADFIVCRITGEFTAGTFEELSEAGRSGKPVLFLINEITMSMWLVAQFCDAVDQVNQVFFETEVNLINHLKDIDTGKTIDRNKWIFLEWEDS